MGGAEFLGEEGDAELLQHPAKGFAVDRRDAGFPVGERGELSGFLGVLGGADGGEFGADLDGAEVAVEVG